MIYLQIIKKHSQNLAAQLEAAIKGELPTDWDQDFPVYEEGKTLASRASSGEAVKCYCKKITELYWWFS